MSGHDRNRQNRYPDETWSVDYRGITGGYREGDYQGYPGENYQDGRGGYPGGGHQGNPNGYPGGGYQGNPNGYPGGGYQGNPNGYPGGSYQGNPNGYPGGNYQGSPGGYPGGNYPGGPGGNYPGGPGGYPGGPYGGKPPKKKGSPVVTFFGTLVLVIALGVFCFAGYKLIGYYLEYKAGSDEYNDLRDDFVSDPDDGKEDNEKKDDEEKEGAGTTDEQTAPAEDIEEGEILTNYKELEDPEVVEEKKETAAKKTTTENGQKKKLPLLKNPINFEELNAINDEIIGWIRIGAIDREYPVAQAKDNNYYLHRTFRKQDNFAGCIFLNCENSRFFTDQNSIVYGHNMNDGSMFGTLKRFQEQKVYDSNPYFWIFAPDFIYQYRIFSSSTVSAVGDPYRVRFTTGDFEEFINTCQASSYINNHGLKVKTDDRIVTLSTCTGDSSTRFIVQGKLEQIYAAAGS